MSNESPCLTCGACCAAFRVSFYWGECQSAGGTVPDELTLQVTPPGERVSCNIYANRSSTCREFDILNEDGSVNEACTRARAIYGLPPVINAFAPELEIMRIQDNLADPRITQIT